MKISKNLKIILYISSVLIVVCLVLLLGNHLPILAKGAIMTTAWLPSYLVCTMLSVLSKSTYQKKEKKMFGITAKLYTVLVFLSSSIYTIGVWLLTPGSLIKNIMLGIGLSVQLLLMFYFLFKRTLLDVFFVSKNQSSPQNSPHQFFKLRNAISPTAIGITFEVFT